MYGETLTRVSPAPSLTFIRDFTNITQQSVVESCAFPSKVPSYINGVIPNVPLGLSVRSVVQLEKKSFFGSFFDQHVGPDDGDGVRGRAGPRRVEAD